MYRLTTGIDEERLLMFYRITRIHFEEDRWADLLGWVDTIRDDVEAIEGFRFADLCRTGPGEGMIVAAYGSQADFDAAAGVVAKVLGDMAQYLSAPSHTHAGTSDRTIGRS